MSISDDSDTKIDEILNNQEVDANDRDMIEGDMKE